MAEIILLKDKEWSRIDSDFCLVTDFSPLSGSVVRNGKVISPDASTPYASVSLECREVKEKITGYITHKIDFANLWRVFRERDIGQEEEVAIYWTTKHYKYRIFRVLSTFMLAVFGATNLPKLFVMVYPKGSYAKGKNNSLPTDIPAQVFIYGSLPLKVFIPNAMKEDPKKFKKTRNL